MGAIFTAWKTTIAGIAAGGLNMFANGTSWKQILVSVSLMFIGALAKDFNVSNSPHPMPQAEAVPSK